MNVARVRLRIWQDIEKLEYGNAGSSEIQTLPSLRLIATLLLGPEPPRTALETRQVVTALLDTGSPYNVIDGGVWEWFERRGWIERLTIRKGLPRFQIGGNRSIAYHLGKLPVGVIDPEARTRRGLLPTTSITVLMLRQAAKLPFPIVLGMHAGILDGRWLIRTPVVPTTGPKNRYDAGSFHGQQWWLQDEPP
jgi:hypothetical protein